MSPNRNYQLKILLLCATLLCTVLYGLYMFKQTPARHKVLGQTRNSGDKTALPAHSRTFSSLVNASLTSNAARGPVETKCPMYQEFRYLDFLHPTLRHRLCRNVEVYRRYPDGFPMCQLPSPFNQDMLNIVRLGSDIVGLRDMHNSQLQMFVYKGNDLISNVIRHSHTWEPQLVHWTLRFALKVPQATFLDMGSNIGVYSIQAAKLGLPVVSLDANIRNLLRLRLTLNAASLNADLVWNFIAPGEQLRYLSFLADCNVGGAGKVKADLPDTVPVMPLSSGRITSLIKTKNVVMKMDIQGGEADFLRMSGRLFTDFNVAAVQMEWWPPMLSGTDEVDMATFFSSRGYKVWQIPGFKPLDPNNTTSWGPIDVMWVRKDFVNLM